MSESNESAPPQAATAIVFDMIRESLTHPDIHRIEHMDSYLKDLELEPAVRNHILKQLEKVHGANDSIVLALVRTMRVDPPPEPELPFMQQNGAC